MALDISGASIGFDSSGVQTYVQNLRVQAIDETIELMTNKTAELDAAVDDCWIGKSADVFKDNMQTDKRTVENSLRQAYDALVSEINQIASTMSQSEETLVQRRSS